jgi:beta-glucosidase
MKIPVKLVLCGVLGLQVLVSGETISGRVIDSITSSPIANATVSLKDLGVSTYTDINGNFALVFTPSGTGQPEEIRPSIDMRFTGGKISFSTDAKELVRIDLYDIRGQKISTLLNRQFDAGKHSLPLPSLVRKNVGTGLYVLKIRKGNDDFLGTFLPMGGMSGTSAEKSSTYAVSGTWALAKAALPDSLPAFRMGYTRKVLTIASYVTQNVGDIKLYQTAEERAITKKVDSLLALMTINEKAGQMTQARKGQLTNAQIASLGIGSMFNGGGDPQGNNTPSDWATMIDGIQSTIASSGPHKIPMIWGQDCVHGVGAIAGTTVFPHNIGLGCTNDTNLLARIGAVVASEAAGCGIRLNFSPCVASPRNEKWGRTYEGFGETPEINSSMGAAYTRGQQGYGVPSKDTAIAVCVKHSIGDGGTTNGTNGGTATLADSTMRAVHFEQYMACGREQMSTIMPSYHAWTRPGGVSFEQTRDSIAFRMLKKEAGLDGFAISDWDAVSSDGGGYNNTGIAQCINAGLDMAMIVTGASVTTWINTIVSLAGSTIPQSRIDDAVRRILRIKFRFHIFDHPSSNATARAQIYSAAHQAVAREAVRKSLVLLKNTGSALPLTRSERITVVGPFADNIGIQCGGWTISWQGQSGNPTNQIAGETILAGMRSVGTTGNITYNSSGAGLVAANIDKIVVVVGESPYAEGNGDNLNNLDLTNTNTAGSLISTCYATGKPVIVVLLSGRPLIIDGEIGNCAAFVAAWLPGSKGIGVADVLYGDYNFTGKLTHIWPATYAQIPINTGKVYSEEQKGTGGTPLYAYGFGLTY